MKYTRMTTYEMADDPKMELCVTNHKEIQARISIHSFSLDGEDVSIYMLPHQAQDLVDKLNTAIERLGLEYFRCDSCGKYFRYTGKGTDERCKRCSVLADL